MKKTFLKSILVLGVVLVSSSQIFSQWVPQTSGITTRLRNVRAVDDNVVWACGNSGVVLRTINGGTTWEKRITNATVINYGLEAFDSLTAWVTGTVGGSADVYIWKTTNGGLTWVEQYHNPTGFGDALRFFDPSNGIYYGDPDPYPSGNWEILTTSNGGTTWNRVPLVNFPPADSANGEYGAALSMDIVGNTIWFGGYSDVVGTPNRIWKSTDKGLTWTVSSYTNVTGQSDIHYMAFSNTNDGVDVDFDGSIARTTDGGATWSVTSGAPSVFRFVANIPLSNAYIAVGSAGLITASSDGGVTWTPMTSGTTVNLYTVDATTKHAWAAGNSGTILKLSGNPVPVELTSFSAVITGKNVTLNWATATEINNSGFDVQRKSTAGDFVSVGFVKGHGTSQEAQAYSYVDKNVESGNYSYRLKQIDLDGKSKFSNIVEVEVKVPNKFELSQNYPNPFNPTTKISYEIAKETIVSLKVYDVIGNEIVTLVNETKPAGTYEVIFDASNLSNGVYLYKIQAGNFTATKKLILMK